MSALSLFLGILLLLISFIMIFFNPQYTIIGCTLLIDIDFCFSHYLPQNQYQAIFKILILLSILILLFHSRKGLHPLILIICLLLLIISFFIKLIYELPNFNFMDMGTSFLTTITGFLLIYVVWDENVKITALKSIACAAPVSAILGIFVNQFVFTVDNKLPGLDSPATLVSISVMGFICSYILYTVYNKKVFWYFCWINILVCGLSNMRGGFIFLTVILLSIFWSNLKRFNGFVKESALKKIMILFPIILAGAIIIGKRILEKTFDFSYSVQGNNIINTSNRFFVWSEILKATKSHRIFGWGIGYTKKIDGVWLDYGYRAVHNEYLRWLVESGYIGVIAMIICFCIIYRFVKKYNIGVNSNVLSAIFIGFAIFSFTDNTMYGTACWITFSLLISLLTNNVNKDGEYIKTSSLYFTIKK